MFASTQGANVLVDFRPWPPWGVCICPGRKRPGGLFQGLEWDVCTAHLVRRAARAHRGGPDTYCVGLRAPTAAARWRSAAPCSARSRSASTSSIAWRLRHHRLTMKKRDRGTTQMPIRKM
jgi:hypothetical protein